MKNFDIIFAVILKKKQTMHPMGTNKWCDVKWKKTNLSSDQAESNTSVSCISVKS